MTKKLIIGVAVLLLGTMLLVFWLKANTGLRAKPRRAWKDNAIADIFQKSTDAGWIESQLAELNSRPPDAWPEVHWLSESLLLMKDGEYIVYCQCCSKQDSRIHDIFVGRGSDGKWYYTTYHFCIGMFVLTSMSRHGQPASLADFVDTYYLREFDGRSAECLNKTWPLQSE